MTTVSPTLDAVERVRAADQAIGRTRRTVEDLRATVSSAIRVLEDAELDSAKARLGNRGGFYLEAAGEHMVRLQARCQTLPKLSDELDGHLDRAVAALKEAATLLGEAETSNPDVRAELAQLRPRVAVLGEMVELARPMAQMAAQHVAGAHAVSREVTPPALLESGSLELSIRSAGEKLGRADEDIVLLEGVVDRAAATAHQSAGIAAEISDDARRRMSQQRHDPGGGQAAPAAAGPAR